MHLFIGQVQDKAVLLTANESHHLHNVLRLKKDDIVQFTDGKGKFGTAVITRSHKNESVLSIIEMQEVDEKQYSVHIALSPTKQNDRTEWFLEKATEIGLNSFTPFTSYHSERRNYKKDRAERIVTAATKQSIKAYLPEVNDLIDFKALLKTYQNFEGQKFIAHCHSTINRKPIKAELKPNTNYLFLIGPEGDFSENEVENAIQAGFVSVSFGEERLRTETAALYACFTASFINK